jgi:hypothetical protein
MRSMPRVERATQATPPAIATFVLASSTEVGVVAAPAMRPGQPQPPTASVVASAQHPENRKRRLLPNTGRFPSSPGRP